VPKPRAGNPLKIKGLFVAVKVSSFYFALK